MPALCDIPARTLRPHNLRYSRFSRLRNCVEARQSINLKLSCLQWSLAACARRPEHNRCNLSIVQGWLLRPASSANLYAAAPERAPAKSLNSSAPQGSATRIRARLPAGSASRQCKIQPHTQHNAAQQFQLENTKQYADGARKHETPLPRAAPVQYPAAPLTTARQWATLVQPEQAST